MDLQLIHVSLLNEHERFNKTKCNFAGGQWPDLTLTSESEISELVLHFMAFLSEIFKNQKGRLKQRHDRHLASKSTRDDSLARNTLVSTLMSVIGKFGFEIYLTNWNDFSQFNKKEIELYRKLTAQSHPRMAKFLDRITLIKQCEIYAWAAIWWFHSWIGKSPGTHMICLNPIDRPRDVSIRTYFAWISCATWVEPK